jgi:hypothetical protein
MDVFQNTRSIRRKRKAHLTLSASPVVTRVDDVDTTLSRGLTDLELGKEFRLDLRSDDLTLIKELGAGNGGTVSKVQHVTTQTIMAKKVNCSSSPIYLHFLFIEIPPLVSFPSSSFPSSSLFLFYFFPLRFPFIHNDKTTPILMQ